MSHPDPQRTYEEDLEAFNRKWHSRDDVQCEGCNRWFEYEDSVEKCRGCERWLCERCWLNDARECVACYKTKNLKAMVNWFLGRPPHDECEVCDGHGKIWKHADPTTGQWIACDADVLKDKEKTNGK